MINRAVRVAVVAMAAVVILFALVVLGFVGAMALATILG